MTALSAPDRASDIKDKLTTLENAADNLPAGATTDDVRLKIGRLHKSLQKGLDEQGTTLGLTTTQVDDLNAGGGTNKTFYAS